MSHTAFAVFTDWSFYNTNLDTSENNVRKYNYILNNFLFKFKGGSAVNQTVSICY